MDEYKILAIYVGMLFVMGVGGIVWLRLRRDIKRFLGVRGYRQDQTGPHITNQ